jgi:DNA repair protein RAD51
MQAQRDQVDDQEDSQMTHEAEEEGPMPIESLQEKGINNGDIKKLIEAGYRTVEAIAFQPKKNLVLVKGLSEAKVDKIIEAASQLVNLGFSTA